MKTLWFKVENGPATMNLMVREKLDRLLLYLEEYLPLRQLLQVHEPLILDAPLYWLVTGSISESKWRKGVRKRMYKLASQWLGYYDGKQPAFTYDEEHNLLLRVLFKAEQNALQFENDVQNETITDVSPIRNLKVITNVTGINCQAVFRRIYQHHYDPDEHDSPRVGLSMISGTTSILDMSRPVFIYQRLEMDSIFGSHYRADSCHLMSRAYCIQHKDHFGDYNGDDNNRLALSADVHRWFDGISVDVPLFNLTIDEVSRFPLSHVEERYEVKLSVRAFDEEAARMLFGRLKEGSQSTQDPLVVKTFIFVTNPVIFRQCLEWKAAEINEKWNKYLNMLSAVD
jgi:hypothetical protein